ncbi:MAG: hypothetical protein ACREE2_05685 [Stellaceae bacterium]
MSRCLYGRTPCLGHSSEGLKCSPDGKYLTVGDIEGSTKPAGSWLFHDHGLDVFRWQNGKLTPEGTLKLNASPAAIRTAWP